MTINTPPISKTTGKSAIAIIFRYSFSVVGLMTPIPTVLTVGLGVAVFTGVFVAVGSGTV